MRRRAFENQSEKRTRRIMEIATKDTIYWVNAKTRLEDVVSPTSEDSSAERRFIRDAHFDYTLHKESSNEVIWAFEFDGPGHRSDPDAIRRDIVKNRICSKAGIPLLRIEDELLDAIDGTSLLEWLIRRWMVYEKIIPRMNREREKQIASMPEEEWAGLRILEDIFTLPPELDTESLFDLDHPYPPLPKISARLMKLYGIREELSLELNPKWRGFDGKAQWNLSTNGGPLPDLSNHGLYCRTFCEVKLRRAEDDWNARPVFSTTSDYLARVGYPVFAGQHGLLDKEPGADYLAPSGPPYGGSLWAAGSTISWYRALKQVETWAARNLPTLR